MITPQKIQEMRKDIDEALKAVAEKHNCTIHAGSANYTSESFNIKLEVVENSSDGSTVTKEELDWKANASLFGLDVDLLGKTVKIQGKDYEIVGLKPRSRKYPVLGKDLSNGKTYKFPAEFLKNPTSFGNYVN